MLVTLTNRPGNAGLFPTRVWLTKKTKREEDCLQKRRSFQRKMKTFSILGCPTVPGTTSGPARKPTHPETGNRIPTLQGGGAAGL